MIQAAVARRRTRGGEGGKRRVDWRVLVRPKASLDMTLVDVAAERLAERRRMGKKVKDLESWLREVETTFAGVRLSELGVLEIIAWLQALLLDGQAPKTVWKKRSFLSSDFEYAIRIGTIDDNPVHRIPRGILPDNSPLDPLRGSLEILSIEIARAMVSDPRIPFYRRIFWALVILTGARLGEASAFCYGDINDKNHPLGELVIQRAWDCREHKLSPFTKTQRVRRIPIHPFLKETLHDARAWYREVAGVPAGKETLIAPFPSPIRGLDFWHENTAIRWWRKDLVTIGAPAIHGAERTLHSSRDTFISIAVNNGADRKVMESLTHPSDPKRKAFDGYCWYTWPTLCDAVRRIEI